MTAKEMFEALGYKQTTEIKKDETVIRLVNVRQFQEDIVTINQKYRQVTLYAYDEWGEMKRLPITVELHLAIAQQMRELGWIE